MRTREDSRPETPPPVNAREREEIRRLQARVMGAEESNRVLSGEVYLLQATSAEKARAEAGLAKEQQANRELASKIRTLEEERSARAASPPGSSQSESPAYDPTARARAGLSERVRFLEAENETLRTGGQGMLTRLQLLESENDSLRAATESGSIAASEEAMQQRIRQLEAENGELKCAHSPGAPVPAPATPASKYSGWYAVKACLASGDVAMLRGQWLVHRCLHENLPVPCRQDLEAGQTGAHWTADELQLDRHGKLRERDTQHAVHVIALSHSWWTREHPDPQGRQLRHVARILAMYMEVHRCEAALFYDWCSIYQPRRAADGHADQKYQRGMATTPLWFAHPRVQVWCVPSVPDGQGEAWDSLPFEERGWPTLEKKLSELLHDRYSVLDLSRLDPKRKISHNPEKRGGAWDAPAMVHRDPPVTPEELDRLLGARIFTYSDDADIARRLYRTAFEDALGQAEWLDFSHLDWDDNDATQLSRLLPLCKKLRELLLNYNEIADAGASAIASKLAQCPVLSLSVYGNQIGDAGLQRLADAWAACGKDVERLHCHSQKMGQGDAPSRPPRTKASGASAASARRQRPAQERSPASASGASKDGSQRSGSPREPASPSSPPAQQQETPVSALWFSSHGPSADQPTLGYSEPSPPPIALGYSEPSPPPIALGYSERGHPPIALGYSEPSEQPIALGYSEPGQQPIALGYSEPSEQPIALGYS